MIHQWGLGSHWAARALNLLHYRCIKYHRSAFASGTLNISDRPLQSALNMVLTLLNRHDMWGFTNIYIYIYRRNIMGRGDGV